MRIDVQKWLSVGLMLLGVGCLLLVPVNLVACTQLRTGEALGGDIGFADDITEQGDRAIYLRLRCGATVYGSSGVAIGGARVLTAAHAIPCDGDLWATTRSGVTLWATVESLDPENDTALLRVRGLDAPRVRSGTAPVAHAVVCAATAHPIRGRICGTVAYVRSKGPGAIVSGLEAVPGNSGAGVYDENGALVGVVITGCKVPGCGQSGASRVTP